MEIYNVCRGGVYSESTFSEDSTVYTMPDTSKMDRTHWASEMPRQNMQNHVNMVKNNMNFVHNSNKRDPKIDVSSNLPIRN